MYMYELNFFSDGYSSNGEKMVDLCLTEMDNCYKSMEMINVYVLRLNIDYC